MVHVRISQHLVSSDQLHLSNLPASVVSDHKECNNTQRVYSISIHAHTHILWGTFTVLLNTLEFYGLFLKFGIICS